MLAPEEIMSLHATARASLEGRCDIVRRTRVRNPNGTYSDSTVTLASNIPCRKVPTGQTPTEQMVMQNTLAASRAYTTFIVDSTVEATRDCIVKYPSGNAREYGIAGILDRDGGEYKRIIAYDDSMGPVTP